jgi:tetratricopeptide (TPR) repeat protein
VTDAAAPQSLDRVEANRHQAHLRRVAGDDDVADSLYRFVAETSLGLLQERSMSADLYLRAAEGYIGLGSADTALVYLEVADFLETRPYYVGRVLIAYGNAYDLVGMRDRAVQEYRRVLDLKSSYPSIEAARMYLKTPYRARGT